MMYLLSLDIMLEAPHQVRQVFGYFLRHLIPGAISGTTLNFVLMQIALIMTLVAVPVIIYLLFRIYRASVQARAGYEEPKSKESPGVFVRLKLLANKSRINELQERAASTKGRAIKVMERARELGLVSAFVKAREAVRTCDEILGYDSLTLLEKSEDIEQSVGSVLSRVEEAEAEIREVEEKLAKYDELRNTAHEKIQDILGVLDQLTSGGIIVGGG